MSVLDRLKNLIKSADEDIDKSLTKETVPAEDAADSIQTSSEEEKEIKSDSETNSDETSKVEVPVEEDVIVPVHAETPEEAEPEEDEEDVDEVAEAEEAEETPEAEIEESEEEAIEETEEEVSVEETPEEAVEEVPEEEVSLESEEEIQEEVEESLDDSEVEEESDEEESSEENEESDNMTLLKENDVYSMDDIDKEFTQKFIDAGIETVDHCFQCGTCGGGCPSGRRTPYRVRQVVRKCLLGLREEVVSDPALWMCTTCYTCQERCPRSVKIVDIIKMARNEAAKAGYMADAHKATGSFVIKTGHGVPINDKTKELRAAIGLSELPPTVHAYPEALEEVQKICVACDFDKLIGYNMETGSLE